jgi:hypothetical protein
MDGLIAALSRPLRLAVLGEPGSGKTSLINHLLDGEALPLKHLGAGRLPVLVRFAPHFTAFTVSGAGRRGRLTTRAANSEHAQESGGEQEPKIVYRARAHTESGDSEGASAGAGSRGEPGGNYVEIALPSLALKDVEFIEIPSLIERGGQAAAMAALIRGADAAIWCTVAHQAWKESERKGWLRCKGRFRDRTLLAVTFADALSAQGQRGRLVQRLESEAGSLFAGLSFASLKAHCAKSGIGPARGEASGGANPHLRDSVQALLDRITADRLGRAQHIAASLASQKGLKAGEVHPFWRWSLSEAAAESEVPAP